MKNICPKKKCLNIVFIVLTTILFYECNSEDWVIEQRIIEEQLNRQEFEKFAKEQKLNFGEQEAMIFSLYNQNVANDLITDNIIQDYFEIIKANRKLDKVTAKFLSSQIEHEYRKSNSVGADYLKSITEETIDKKNYDFIFQIDFNSYRPTQKIQILYLILHLSGKVRMLDQNVLSEALLQYGLYLIENNGDPDYLQKAKAEIFYELFVTAFGQAVESASLITYYLDKSNYLFNKLKLSDDAMFTSFFSQNINHGIYCSIDSLQFLEIELSKKISLSLNFGFNLLAQNPTKALDYFLWSEKITSHLECHWIRNLILNSIGMAYIEANDFSKATEYFSRAKEKEFGNQYDCDEFYKKMIAYQNILYQKDFYHYFIENYSKEFHHNKILKEKYLGKQLMSDQADHLDDFLMMNNVNLMKLYLTENIQQEKLIKELLKIMSESKEREFSGIRRRSEDSRVDLANLRKQEYLKNINNYKDTSDYSREEYSKLVKIYLKEYFENSTSEVVSQVDNFRLDDHYGAVNNGDYQLLEYFSFDQELFGYLFNKAGIQFFKVNDSLLNFNLNQISTDFSNQKYLYQRKDEILKILIGNSFIRGKAPIIVIPDGRLSSFPFHLIFGGETISRDLGLSTILRPDSFMINPKSSLTYSYTDSLTLASKTLRTQPELNYGFEESKAIHQILKTDNTSSSSTFYTGSAFTQENFQKHLNSDLYHISAHAATNLDNRLDNYIIIRDEKGEPQKLYTYEIEAMNAAPKVVVLSACDTGIGVHKNGKGTYSISRAFRQNGTQTIIKTLWKVKDTSTKDFMVDMYTNWNTGISLGDALNKTRRKFEADPNYTLSDWAGFVLEGNPNVFLN